MNKVAVIDENQCVGCTKCIIACPIDAIIGSAGNMHTVLNEECIGCKLCIDPCPVDCITLEELNEDLSKNYNKQARALQAKQRFAAKQTRIKKSSNFLLANYSSDEQSKNIKEDIQNIMQRYRAKKSDS